MGATPGGITSPGQSALRPERESRARCRARLTVSAARASAGLAEAFAGDGAIDASALD
jgi:hypothetical protein